MNVINSSIGNLQVKEGLRKFNTSQELVKQKVKVAPIQNDPAKVVDNIVQTNIKEDVQQLQRLSDIINGNRLQFNVDEELGDVVIKVVDPNTNEVIREIPSQDIQKLKISIRMAIGLIFDELV